MIDVVCSHCLQAYHAAECYLGEELRLLDGVRVPT